MQLIDGKEIARSIREEIKQEVDQLKKQGRKTPHLAAILVGNDAPSETYVSLKIKACEEVGFTSSLFRFDEKVTQAELLDKIRGLNQDNEIDGYIIQLPLPVHIDESHVTEAVNYKKDVDGFHPINLGRMLQGLPSFISATPMGIMELLKRSKIETAGKHCVVVGRSNIVGTPVSILMSRNAQPGNATVTLCHSRTKDLEQHCKNADIIISAVGKAGTISAAMVKEGAVVIDVGTNRVDDASKEKGYRLSGDVDFDNVAPKCSFITPVPGGVGPMTIASLLMNTLKACKKEIYA